jgi:hypothetical protein
LWLAATVVAYLALILVTTPSEYIDSFNYAKHIADHHYGKLPPGSDPFFDFGHVLWRPLGYLLWTPLRVPLRSAFNGDDILAVGSVLIALSIVAGLAGAVLMFAWLTRTTRNLPVAVITVIGYLATNALLFYTQTGMAYIAGLTCQAAALFLWPSSPEDGRVSFVRGAIAGAFLGLSVTIWFPYVLAAGGVFCYCLLFDETNDVPTWRFRLAGLAGLVIGTIAVVAVVYGAAISYARLTSIAEVSRWISNSRYDKLPDRGLLRMLGGIPQGLLALGNTNAIIKQAVFAHTSVALVDLAKAVSSKIAPVYVLIVCTAFALWRSARGRKLLVCLCAIAAPLVYFAAFLFEATPPERYLPIFPLGFAALSLILADQRSPRLIKAIVYLFFCLMLGTNLGALSRWRSEPRAEAARIRVQAINERVQLGDRIVFLSFQDEALRYVNARPFDPISRNRYSFVVGLPWGSAHKAQWRADFAGLARATWSQNGRVWISDRFLAMTPEPGWWIEGDLAGIRWTDIVAFYRQFELSNSFGGTDGFSEVPRTSRNEALCSARSSIIGH